MCSPWKLKSSNNAHTHNEKDQLQKRRRRSFFYNHTFLTPWDTQASTLPGPPRPRPTSRSPWSSPTPTFEFSRGEAPGSSRKWWLGFGCLASASFTSVSPHWVSWSPTPSVLRYVEFVYPVTTNHKYDTTQHCLWVVPEFLSFVFCFFNK